MNKFKVYIILKIIFFWVCVGGCCRYYTTNRLTEKSDVFSYGVVLLEMITGRPAIGNININEQMGQSSNHVIQWVNSVLGDGDVKSIVDTRLREDFDVNSAWKAVELAMACVSVTSTTRPPMNHMVNELKECLATDCPPRDDDKLKQFCWNDGIAEFEN